MVLKEKNITVFGAGINGIVIAIYLSRMGFKVNIIERSNVIGGQFSSINKNNEKFDKGLYIPQLTGISEIDNIFKEACDLSINTGVLKDPAGHVLGGIHNELTFFPDINKFPKDILHNVQKELQIAASKKDVTISANLNLNDYFSLKFGETIKKVLFERICKKFWGLELSELSSIALKVVHLQRLSCYEEKESLKIKNLGSNFDARVAYPNQFEIPLKFINEKTPSIYPKKYGLYNLLKGLLKICKKEGIDIQTNIEISNFEIKKDEISAIHISKDQKNSVINPKYIVWAAPTGMLYEYLFNFPIKYTNQPIDHITTYVKTKSKPNIKDVYWSWDYDNNNNIIRISFPYNYCQELDYKNSFFILVESHLYGKFDEEKIKSEVINYLNKTNIVNKKDISEIIIMKNASRKFFIPSVENVNKDLDIVNSIDNRNISNLIFASAKISKGVFYLHDLLEDAFMRLKSIKK